MDIVRLPTDILLIGHVTRDLIDEMPESGHRPGGTVSFAAVVACQLGRHPTVITRAADPADVASIPDAAQILRLPSTATTTFANVYSEHGRVQHCYTPAPAIRAEDIPIEFRKPSVVLLGPLVNEIGPDVAALFPDESLVVAGPQGWMRRWDETGRVYSKTWDNAPEILPHLDVLILSLEDIEYDTSRLMPFFDHLSLIVVTEYHDGSTILQKAEDGRIFATKIAPRPATERDPTGAGDTFATAFIIRFQETGDPVEAARFANVTASFGVESEGVAGIPNRQQVLDYMAATPFTPDPPREWNAAE